MNALHAGDEFLTKAVCFQTTADELQAKLSQATLALQQGRTGNSRKVGGYLFSTMILRALATECALKALAAKSTGKYRRDKLGHDLSTLYDDLTPEVKELVASITEALGVASPVTILEKHRGDFVEWRYPPADGRVLSANFTDLQRALEVLIESLNDKRFLELCRETHAPDRPDRLYGA